MCPAAEEPSHCFKTLEQSNTIKLTGLMDCSKIGERRKSASIGRRRPHIGKLVTSYCRNRTNKET